MVTSSAVVGSSAIKSLGWQASAIAIMTRWRRPPESSCGYCAKRRSGAPIPTMRSSSSTRARIAARAHIAMQAQRLADLEAHRKGRVQAGHRLLKDHADAVAAHVAHRALVQRQQVLAVEREPPALDLRRRAGQEPHDGARGDALAAAGLADQPHDPSGIDREGQIVDDPRQAALGMKPYRKILDLEQRHGRAQEVPPPSQSSTTRGK